MEQLLVHVFGDYWTQSCWMGLNKSKKTLPCLIHVLIYTSCFLILTTSWKALAVIGITHFILDRFPIILKRLIWFKNHLMPYFGYPPFEKCNVTGYYDNIMNEVTHKPYEEQYCYEWVEKGKRKVVVSQARLNYVSMWLYIIKDNWCHLAINYLALKYLT
jgi:hypothetical protein